MGKPGTKRARFQPPSSRLAPNTPHPYPNPDPDPARQLPNELIDLILGYLKADDDLTALAKVAQTSRRMYSIAIPRLYETVTITQRNKYQFWYGHSEDNTSPSEQPTQKDAAASLTRKVILDYESPKAIMVKGFRCVEEVVVSAQCLDHYMATTSATRRFGRFSSRTLMSKATSGLMQCLETLASNRISSTPLHVTFIMDQTTDGYEVMEMVLLEDALATLTFDFLNWPSHDGFWHLQPAYYAGAPVQFAPTPFDPALVLLLGLGLNHIFRLRGFVSPSSRIYLCDIPKLVLSPEELVEAAETANHVAKLKIYKIYKIYHLDNADYDLTESQRWIDFDSRVKFVEPDFRPSPADVAAIMDGRQYLKNKNLWL